MLQNHKSQQKSVLKNATILITGGTGSFGRNFVQYLLRHEPVKKIIVLSRDEFKQHDMARAIPDPRLRFFLGDVRDLPRLQRAFQGVDVIVHAAALKQIPALEYNPFEAIKTNILGTQNVIEAAIDQKVKKVLLISTDKAAYPINLYGSSKLCAEKLISSANFYTLGTAKFSAVRYGNVMGSRGSIIEHLLKNRDLKKVPLTHPDMTRFWITFEESFALVMFALTTMEGGETFIPKIPSMKVADMFEALLPGARHEVTGIRPGEKMHEALLTADESRMSYDLGGYYAVLPPYEPHENIYDKYRKHKKVPSGFHFSSHTNTVWLTKKDFLKRVEKITLI